MMAQASLSRRLLTAAAAFIVIALVAATVLIGFVLHRFIQGQIDQRLDTQIVFLASMLRVPPDGRLWLAGSADGPPFERPRHGWYWQVSGANATLRSASLEGETLNDPAIADSLTRAPPPPKAPPKSVGPKEGPKDGPKGAGPKGRPADRAMPADGVGPDGEQLHFRIRQFRFGDQPITIATSAPREAVMRPLGEALTTLALSLAAMGIALLLATVLQVRLGLRPLALLRQSIADVRAGRVARVPSAQPREVAPLVHELNGLLDENAENLSRARRHVANLAHGLKTPLSTLSLALAAQSEQPQLACLTAQMQRQIRHHLGRARAAALSGPTRAQTDIAVHLGDLATALGRIHAQKAIHFVLDSSVQGAVACEAQDFDEMAGNLMENAFVWAKGRVAISAERNARGALDIHFDDDGPGIPETDAPSLCQAGARLDETVPGYGFGLSITRELAELYGGELALRRAPLGGLRARLTLPMVAPVDQALK